MSVMTVTGPIDARDLGVTLAHEHLFIDTSAEYREPPPHIRAQLELRGIDLEAPLTIEALGYLTRDPLWSRRNQVVDDYDVLAAELTIARRAGVRSIVDATPIGLGRQPAELIRLARQTAVRIVAGTGYYRRAFIPPGVESLSVEQLEERFTVEVVDGIAGTAARAGLLGELGTSGSILHPVEERVLVAAGRVQAATKVPVLVHTEGHVDIIMRALRLLDGAGADLTKVNIAHVAGTERSGWREIVATGATFGMDSFGFEYFKVDSRTRFFPTDEDNIRALVGLVEAGCIDSVLVSNDVCHQSRLHSFGGWGFDHIQTNLEPHLRKAGLGDAELHRLFVVNPARFLDSG